MTRAASSAAPPTPDARAHLVVSAVGGSALEERARAEAARLGLPFEADPAAGDLALLLDEHGWALLDPRPGAPGAVRCDLLAGELGERLRAGGRGESRLARALGLKRHPAPLVLDATAGLGRESALAAALGCHVIACERSPVVALLLRGGLERASAAGLAPLVSRIDLRVRDAREVMAGLPEDGRPDVVLVDPMFPERRKTAAAKKEMQLLQRLLGHGDAEGETGEAPALLAAALTAARRRVVVKRPVHAPPIALGERRPDLAVDGRAARYDVYLIAPERGRDTGD